MVTRQEARAIGGAALPSNLQFAEPLAKLVVEESLRNQLSKTLGFLMLPIRKSEFCKWLCNFQFSIFNVTQLSEVLLILIL